MTDPVTASIERVHLADLDGLPASAMALFCWSDVRPLKGVLALVDWRLCGRISRAVMANIFCGHAGEVLLLPGARRMRTERLFVFGLGPRAHWGAHALTMALAEAAHVMQRAQALPGLWATPAIGSDPRLERAFVAAVQQIPAAQRATILAELG